MLKKRVAISPTQIGSRGESLGEVERQSQLKAKNENV